MQVLVFNRSLSNTRILQQVCVNYDLDPTIKHCIESGSLAASASTRLLFFDQSVLGTDRSITSAMYRSLPQDVIAVTCENPTVSYVVAHMRMGAKWVFSGDSDAATLNAGFSNLLKCAENVGVDYREHLELKARFAAVSAMEWKVLNSVLDGRRNKQIAKELDVSIRTVEARRANAYSKLGVHSLAHLVRTVDRAEFLNERFSTVAVQRMLNCMDFDFSGRHNQIAVRLASGALPTC